MRTRTFVLILIGFLILVAGVFAMHGDGGRKLHSWIGAIHGAN